MVGQNCPAHLKNHIELPKARNSQGNLDCGKLIPPDIMMYHKTMVNKKFEYWYNDIQTCQWRRIGNIQTYPHIYSQLIYVEVDTVVP